jgi:hypothetical protein
MTPDHLLPGRELKIDEELKSPKGAYVLIMQSDGNLVLYRAHDMVAIWATYTHGKGANRAVMQHDGNFVLYRSDNVAVWSSNTHGRADVQRIQLQSDGNLVIYSAAGAVWASRSEQIHGRIGEKWTAVGAQNHFLGEPISTELQTPDGRGRFNHFQGGSIYWTPQADARIIHGAIRDKWASLDWERGFLGYPTSDQAVTPNGKGQYVHFGSASIYWTNETGAHVVLGDIRNAWQSVGWENSALGFPITDETVTPDRRGRFSHFQGGSIYWTPETGAHIVDGPIRDKWASFGWEQSFLGFPTSNVMAYPHENGSESNFEYGNLVYFPNRRSTNPPNTQFLINVWLTKVHCIQTESIHSSDKFSLTGAVFTGTKSEGVALEMIRINNGETRVFNRLLFSETSKQPKVGVILEAWDLDDNPIWFENVDRVREVSKTIAGKVSEVILKNPQIGVAGVASAGAVLVAGVGIPELANLIFAADENDWLGKYQSDLSLDYAQMNFAIGRLVRAHFAEDDANYEVDLLVQVTAVEG